MVKGLPQEFYDENCILCDDIVIMWFDGTTKALSELITQPLKKGIMCINKSMVAFINENGDYYAMPLRSSAMKALREAGYKEEYIYVPFASGENIAGDDELNMKLELLIKRARAEARQKVIMVTM